MAKKALITGITGQDGSYLAELLLEKGYEVHGLVRYVGLEDPENRFRRIQSLLDRKVIQMHWGSVTDYPTIWKLIAKIKPDEVYHLAAISSVKATYDDEIGSLKTNLDGTLFLLSAIRELSPQTKFYFAGSSEMFGQPPVCPQDENTPFNPVSPYAIAKTAGFHFVKMYRDRYGLFAVTGITYNHESPRRGLNFVTRKITLTAVKIKKGLEKELRLGDLEARRDWGFAGDFVQAMWLALQAEKADDYVIGTGISHSVQDFVEEAFGMLGLNPQQYVTVDKEFVRPLGEFEFRANPCKIKERLRWQPKVDFHGLVELMVKEDLKQVA